MKNLLYFVGCAALALIFSTMYGCQDENLEASPNEELYSGYYPANLDRVEEMFSQLGMKTRSVSDIEDIVAVGSGLTRAGSDTLAYLVNYKNNGGFAIIGNTPYNDIYAISPSGHLSLEGINNCPPLKAYMEDCMADAQMFSSLSSAPSGGVLSARVLKHIDEKLTDYVQSWNQEAPFNDSCPINPKLNKKFAVGCVPLSIGMVLSFYRWPKGIYYPLVAENPLIVENQFNFIWDMLKDDAGYHERNQYVAKMLAFLRDRLEN